MPASVAVVILTRNEAIHVGRALASVASFATSTHVVDCGSSDETVAIARAHGADVLHHDWINHADQFRWAIDHISSNAAWVLRLDADEIIEPDLAAAIADRLPTLEKHVVGITFDRKRIFMGRTIRHGGCYPQVVLRLFKRGFGTIEQRWMDEHISVNGGAIGHFHGGFADHNLHDLGHFIDKHNGYATREAIDVLDRRHQLFAGQAPSLQGAPVQVQRRRQLKERLYYRLPFPLAALAYFLVRYLVQRGFLDGREGLIYHWLQAYWYRFLVGAKLLELERLIEGLADKVEMRRCLATATGLDLENWRA
jgi:glycosyltransferase involved in cell wall biosynthesis